jgi:nucleoside-diphosphate-sugar epimerase
VEKQVLVAGAAGFVGFHTTLALINHGYRVTAVDNLDATLYSAKEKILRFEILGRIPEVKCLNVDINDLKLGEQLTEVSSAINCAAIPGLLTSWTATDRYFNSNTLGPYNLIRAVAEKSSNFKFIHLSTSSVYGDSATTDEDGAVNPSSPYGISKHAGEQLLMLQANNLGIEAKILRLFSVYGSHQRPDMGIRIFMEAMLNGKEFGLTANGKHERSFTHVFDVVNAILSCLDYCGSEHTFNIGGSETVTILELIETIENVVGKPAKYFKLADRMGDQITTSANFSRARLSLSYMPAVSLMDGIREQFEWQKNLINKS